MKSSRTFGHDKHECYWLILGTGSKGPNLRDVGLDLRDVELIHRTSERCLFRVICEGFQVLWYGFGTVVLI